MSMEDGEKLEALKSRFISLCSTVKRDGMDALMEWLEKSDFYTAPASSRFHGCYRGGLLEHSLNVYDALVGMVGRYPDLSIDPESVIVVALFHDLTKANYYAVDYKNVKVYSDSGSKKDERGYFDWVAEPYYRPGRHRHHRPACPRRGGGCPGWTENDCFEWRGQKEE